MPSRVHLTAVLVFAALIWGTLLVIDGTAVSIALLKPLNPVVGVVMFGLLAFERWLWRWHRLYPWFVSIPDLNGTWKGTFKSDFIDADGSAYPETVSFLVIRQTLSSLSVRLITNRSNSAFASGAIETERDGIKNLVGVYTAHSKALDQLANPPHQGATILRIIGRPPRELEGCYWTDRKSQGELRFTTRIKRQVESYGEGLTAFG